MSEGADEYLEELLAQPRVTGALLDGQQLLVLTEIAHSGRARAQPHLLVYDLQRAEAELREVVVDVLGVAPLLSGGHLRWLRRGTKAGIEVHLPGRVAQMDLPAVPQAVAASAGALYALIPSRNPGWADGGPHRSAVRQVDAGATLGGARGGNPRLELYELGLPLGSTGAKQVGGLDERRLTGDLSILADSSVVLGQVRFMPDCSRRFGLAVLRDGKVSDVWLDEDLTDPIAAPTGSMLACLGETVAEPFRPPMQHVVVMDLSGTGSVPRRYLYTHWLHPRAWLSGRQLLCTAEEDGARRLLELDVVSGAVRTWEGLGSVAAASVGSAGVCWTASAIDEPPSVHVRPHIEKQPRPVVRPASDLVVPGRLRRVKCQVPDWGPRAAWLCEPHESSGRQPVLVWFHGGPLNSWTDWSWRWNPWPFVQAGYSVLMPDPPLSLGYGQRMHAQGWTAWRTGVAESAVAQVRSVLETEPGLHAGRLAVMGGSFGGYLALATAAALKARLVVSHGGMWDLAAVARGSDVYWHWLREYGSVDTNNDVYRRESLPALPPSPQMRACISHGLLDDTVPPSEAVATHRALRRAGVVSELVLVPDEGHSITKPDNVRAWHHWVMQTCAAALQETSDEE